MTWLQKISRSFVDLHGFLLQSAARVTFQRRPKLTRRAADDGLEQREIQRPLFQLDGDATSDGVAVLLRIMKSGWPVTVQEVGTSVFPPRFGRTGQEATLVNFTAREGIHLELAARPGNVVLRDRHPLFVDAVPLPATPR